MCIRDRSTGEWFYDEEGNADFVNNKAVREMFDVIKTLWNDNCEMCIRDRYSSVMEGMAFSHSSFWISTIMRPARVSSGPRFIWQ